MKKLLACIILLITAPSLISGPAMFSFWKTVSAGGGTPIVTGASITSSTAGVSSLNIVYSESVSIGAGGSGTMSAAASGGSVTLGTSAGLPGTSESIPITNRPILGTETGTTRTFTQPTNGREATTGGIDLASYTTQAVTNSSNVVVYDDYAGSGALSGNYTDVIPGIARVSGVASVAGTDPGGITAYTGLTPSANCRASITLTTAPDATHAFNIYLRFDVATGNGYGTALENGNTLTIYRFDANVPTSLGATTVAYSGSDVFGAAISGSIVTILKNGTTALTGSSDATYSTAQPVAIGMIGTGATTITFDNLVIQNLP